MSSSHFNSRQSIKLLIDLLNEEVVERDAIAENLHNKKSPLGVVMMLVSKLEKLAKDQGLSMTTYSLIKEMQLDSLKALSKIYVDISPPLLKLGGLVEALKRFPLRGNLEIGLKLECITDIVEPLPANASRQLGIYKVCTTILDYFYGLGYKEAKATLILSRVNELEVQLTAYDPSGIKLTEEAIKKKLRNAQGRIVWQSAVILPETNWVDSFSLSFVLGESV